jgi:hypothetical protein
LTLCGTRVGRKFSNCVLGELPRQAGEIFSTLSGDENKHSSSSSHICSRLLYAVPKHASSEPSARRRLSRVQHGRRHQCPQGPYPGVANTAVGWFSLFSNSDGSFNTAVGAGTLLFNIGDQSAFEGVNNTAVGAAALLFNTTGSDNTATGVGALLNNTEGTNNTATGEFALNSNTTGNLNTAIGLSALFSNTPGIFNTAEGGDALVLNTTGGGNTAIGVGALSSNTTGNGNIAIGSGAGHDLTTGDQNIVIGNPNAFAGESNTMRIGGSAQTRAFIAAIRGVATGNNDAVNVVIDSDGQLGTVSSSRRYKKEIKAMEHASEAILAQSGHLSLRERRHTHTAIWFDRRESCRDKPRPGGT